MGHGLKDPMEEVQDGIIREMSALEDRLAKYEYLVELGRALTSPENIRTDDNRVSGCQSQVWIRAEVEDGLLRFHADSDALITRGIIALLLRVLDGREPEQILSASLYFLEDTGLATQLSPSRANGLTAMVKEIREHAVRWAGEREP
jgi:cysteine desulfuration protein SufE